MVYEVVEGEGGVREDGGEFGTDGGNAAALRQRRATRDRQ
ncbi:hypothetical protein AGMMS49531_10510 [Endomicrobiia bacterium]|nr:hypothetical protein AGMMS49531_10510 [Endomicrobiia bacterium]